MTATGPTAAAMLELIRTRRVTRNMSARPVERQLLEAVLEAGRWSPVGGNQRVIRFVAVDEPRLLRQIRMMSPGMMQEPTALIVLCLDAVAVAANESSPGDIAPKLDLGAAMQTMMLAAHALGIASGPVTSFAKAGVRVILNLPDRLSPEVIVTLGYRGEGAGLVMASGRGRTTWQSLTDWGRFPG